MQRPWFKNIGVAGASVVCVVAVALLAIFWYWDGSMISIGKSSPGDPQVLGWIPYWDQEEAIASFKDNVDLFTDIGVFWYLADPSGAVVRYEDAYEDTELIDFAQQRGVRVLAVITNLPEEDGTDWDADLFDDVAGSAVKREKHIKAIVDLVEDKNFDGVNIDYEALRADQRDIFTVFIRDLAEELHKNGKLLGISLMAKQEEGDPNYSNGSEAQDWGELAVSADQLYVMAYDEHWDGSEAGPIASVPWVKTVMTYARELIPADKLFLGVPLYAYDWPAEGGVIGLTYSDLSGLIEKFEPRLTWNRKAKSFFFEYEDSEVSHEVWYEDAASFREKMEVAKRLKLHNVAVWRLGGEDPAVWENLSKLR